MELSSCTEKSLMKELEISDLKNTNQRAKRNLILKRPTIRMILVLSKVIGA